MPQNNICNYNLWGPQCAFIALGFIQCNHKLITTIELDDIMFTILHFVSNNLACLSTPYAFVFVVVFTHLMPKEIAFLTIPTFTCVG